MHRCGTAWPVVLILLVSALAGCLPLGKPVVSERSAEAQPPRPSDAGVLRPSQPPAVPAPVLSSSEQPTTSQHTYTVQRGETLYAIAWRLGLDHRSLARANRIAAPYTIYPGQKLQLNAEARSPWKPGTRERGTRKPGIRKPDARKPAATPRAAVPRASLKPQAKPAPAKPPTSNRSPLLANAVGPWVWPVAGKPAREFSSTSKGMDFNIASATPVRAAGSGEVVYAGNGIGGFERLVIIKHSHDLLSAYGFNGAALVQEQQHIKAGGKVADIRNTGRTAQVLHFELRRNGIPVNPRSKLP